MIMMASFHFTPTPLLTVSMWVPRALYMRCECHCYAFVIVFEYSRKLLDSLNRNLI